ncbi:beta family protein [Chryseobacterium sp.]|jgi:hypothetical protein|uniref:beta family protein n=1 Tax=Chryseobacterium sp. TaxID=1871047 RepID=UPI0028508D16|nr:beta family protein [Chryseobacterium sp.]MDR3026604.1 beta family protein [Chryseobacterium sp.]
MRQNLLYVPILKAKEGEFKGLEVCNQETKDKLIPLFEIVNIPWNYEEERESKTIDNHLDGIGRKIEDSINNNIFFIDSRYIDEDRTTADGIHHLTFLFNDFRAKQLKGIPVTSFKKHILYRNAVKEIYNEDKLGICLRLEVDEIPSVHLMDQINQFLEFYEITPENVDLVIDLKNITVDSKNLYYLSVTTILNNNFPYIERWNSLILASTSFPSNLSDINANTIDSIERIEWLLYLQIKNNLVTRIPVFGDYSIANSEITEMDPRIIQMSASVRYTHSDYWLIVRGRSTKLHGFGQYPNLCRNLIARPEYSGEEFSWADKYIYDCSNGTVGTGNATTWRKVGNNHHFEFVVSQLSM